MHARQTKWLASICAALAAAQMLQPTPAGADDSRPLASRLKPLPQVDSSALFGGSGFSQDGSSGFRTFKRTPTFSREGSEGCLFCHSGEFQRSISTSPHGDTGNPLTPMARQGCESCHGPASFHVSRAHGGRGFPPLIRFGRGAGASGRDVQLEACLDCHGLEGAAVSVGFTGSAHDRRPISCAACHEAHAESDPMRDPQRQAETCYRCHADQRTGHRGFGNKPIDVSSRPCASCHDVHRVP